MARRYSSKPLWEDPAAEQRPSSSLTGRRAQVAAAAHYPVFVSIAEKRMRLPTAAALRARYDATLTPAYLAPIPHLMFVNDQGLLRGSRAVWFNGAGR